MSHGIKYITIPVSSLAGPNINDKDSHTNMVVFVIYDLTILSASTPTDKNNML